MAARLTDPPTRPRDSSLAKGRGRLRVVAVAVRRRLPQHRPAPDRHGRLAARRRATRGTPDRDGRRWTRQRPQRRASRADIVDRNGLVLATNLRVPGVYADPSRLVDKAAAARRLAAILPGVDAARSGAAIRRAAGTSPGSSIGSRRRSRRRSWSSACPGSASAWPSIGSIPRAADQPRHGLRQCRRASASPASSAASSRIGLSAGRRAGGAEPGSAHPADRARGAGGRVTGASRPIGANAMVLDRSRASSWRWSACPTSIRTGSATSKGIEYLNRNLGEVYELGSVFKILTIAAALDTGKVGAARQVRRHRQAADRALPDR